MTRFISPSLSGLTPYVPGEQPRDKSYVKLNTNENPFPPPPAVIEAARREAGRLNLYSDPDCLYLRESLARYEGLEPENVLVTNGSDEALSFIFFAFKGGFIFPNHTYGFYKVFAELYGAPYEEAPLKPDFTVDVDAFITSGKNAVIANPNAPTGLLLPLSEIERILDSNGERLVIVDEAYVDFGGESAASLLKKYENLIVTRTFSKSRSLAGMRLGYILASKELIADLNAVRCSINPYNVDRVALAAGAASLECEEYFREKLEAVKENRAYASRKLETMGFTVIPSRANFIFAKRDGVSGEELYLSLKKRGVLVRHFKKSGIEDYVRITVGTREEMDILISKLEEILV